MNTEAAMRRYQLRGDSAFMAETLTEDQLRLLRSYYNSFRSHVTLLSIYLAENHVEIERFQGLQNEIARLHKDFPGRFPEFKPLVFTDKPLGLVSRILLVRPRRASYYQPQEIMSYLAAIDGRIEAYLDQSSALPLTETRLFPFVKDANVRKIVERDYSEIQRAFISRCWKSVIILTGGVIEAVLADLLSQRESQARACREAPKGDILKWDLEQLIDAALEMQLVSPGVGRLSHPVRQYRNLVHPGNEIRNKLTFEREEARIALEVLNMLHRDLS